jgi:PAS domain S-box-containing protein
MPAVQYPFIDIAVHERVKDHFARGEAMVLFSLDLADVYWANGRGAALFGKPVIYDLIEDGPNRSDVTFRQVEASSQQIAGVGDRRKFLIRIPSGFQRIPVEAVVERIRLNETVDALLFAVPVGKEALSPKAVARDMLQGFDDDDTYMAVLGDQGEILARSPGFDRLGLTAATARTLVSMAAGHPDRLVKRPVPTAKGYLPAAIGMVGGEPALHLLFAVETILGNMGPATPFPEEVQAVPQEPVLPEAAASADAEPDRDPEPLEPIVDEGPAEEPAALSETREFVEVDYSEVGDDMPILTEDMDDLTGPDAPFADVQDVEWEAVETAAQDEPTGPREAFVEPAEDLQAGASEEPDPSEAPEAPELPEETATADAQVAPDEPGHAEADAAEIDPASAEDPPPVTRDGFTYNPAARPTRFVWKIDAQGQFSEVSSELAAAVGPHAENLTGTSFIDMAGLLDLDPEGKIAELLGRRDTWSGKTIYWPIEGTSLRAPVDLAALPTYKRNREFDGFRGFGIVRLSDAIEDPQAIGLTLSGDTPVPADAGDVEEVGPEAAVEEPVNAESGAEDVVVDSSEAPVAEPPMADEAPAAGELAVEVESRLDDPLLDETESEEADVPVEQSGPAQEEDRESAGSEASNTLEGSEDAPWVPDDSADLANDAPDEEFMTASAEPPAEPDVNEPMTSIEEPPRVEPPVLRISEPARPPEEDKVIRLEERRMRGREGLTPGEQEAFREIARQLEALKRDGAEDADESSVPSERVDSRDSLEGSDAPARTDDVVPFTAGDDGHAGMQPDPDEQAPADLSGPVSEASESEQLEILAASIPARTAMDGALSSTTLDEIPVALLIHAGERLIHANPEFLKLSGYRSLADLEKVGGLDSLLHHKDLEDMPEQSGGLSLVRADDQLVPVTARLQSIRWDDSTALLLALIPSGPRPVAVEPQAPALTDEEEERLNGRIHDLEVEVDELRSILETATDGVVIIGPDGDIRSMNRSASALFDYDEAETRGKPFVMLFAHESHRAVADYLAGMTGHGVASVLNDGREVIGREASGGFIPLFMTIGKLSASNGFCAVIRDITQWKRSEEDLKSAKRAAETANAHKSDFLARVSHEIRTPLNAIIGFSDMMAIEHFGPIGHPRYVEYANDIARSGRLVLDIVNDLLDISKIEAGEMELEFTAVGLNEAVSEAVSLVQPQAHSQRVIIRTAFSDAVPDVVADLRSVKQIVLNILANAIRFTPAGGQIVVSTSYETNGSVVLRIRDTGVGMTRAELEQAMKPFRQVTAGARKRGDGTGLGLPLTKAMVDANRASFAIQSAPNEGTLVEITFPSPRVLAN